MEECKGLCEYGDKEYDSDNDPTTYDGADCTCVRCLNFTVCEVWSKHRLCSSCRIDFGPEPLAAAGVAACPVCHETTACLQHPAGCGHVVCGPCIRKLLQFRGDLPPPSDYGFSRDCDCDSAPAEWGTATCSDCAGALEAWELTEAGEIWMDASMQAEAAGLACPLCRARPRAPAEDDGGASP